MKYVIEFAFDCEIRGLTKHTIESYKSTVHDFLSFIKDPTTATMEDLRNHLRVIITRQYKGSTLNSYYAALNAFYDFLIFEKKVQYNPIPEFKKRYVMHMMYTNKGDTRQILSVEDMKGLIKEADQIQDLALMMVLAKDGLRRGECLDLQVDNIDLKKDIITVPEKAKRARNTLFIDPELHKVLEEYLEWREPIAKSSWLWISPRGGKIHKDKPGKIIARYGYELDLHEPNGPLEKRLTPHCFRHWFTTHLYKAGMDPEYIKWLRGDSLEQEAWEIYNHIDTKDVRDAYYRCIPRLL